MKFLFYALLIYLAYQFIFNLVIPVYRTTRKIKKGFREMSARMSQSDGNERMQAQQNHQSQATNFDSDTSKKPFKPRPDDYIEFEEIK